MKTILLKRIVGIVLFISSLAACIGSPSRQLVPTATAVPTLAPTSTVAPTPAPLLRGKYEMLSPEDMRYDMNELFHRIETVHPNPYAKRPKVEIDRGRQRLDEELGEPMTVVDFYRKIFPLIYSLGDLHTDVYLPHKIWDSINNETFFPLWVEFDGHRAFITNNFTVEPDISPGDELLSINGVSLPDIQKDLAPFIEDRYPFIWAFWFFHGSIPEYQVEILPAGQGTPLILKVPSVSFAEIAEDTAEISADEPVTYERIPDEPIGKLTINTFVGIGPLLKPAFKKMREEGIQHLIIDVRYNSGGPDIPPLMDYISDQPYKICARSYKPPFGGYGSGEPREAECIVYEPFDTAEHFKGKIYLLIGSSSISAPIMLGTILQDYELATLIGEKTRDTASFCASAVRSVLPRTKLEYSISTECYVRPNGILDDQPLIPDITIDTTLQDQLSGKDPVLDYTLEMIRDGVQNP